MSCSPSPCEPNRGLSTSGRPGPASRATTSAAASRRESTKVSGVGMRWRASSRLVIALSTERSMACGPFHTVVPAATSACRAPSRIVVASKVPPAMVRRSTPSGRSPPKPGTRRGSGYPVSIVTSASENRTGAAPRSVRAVSSRALCQAPLSAASPIRIDRFSQAKERATNSGTNRPARWLAPERSEVTITSAGLNRCLSMA